MGEKTIVLKVGGSILSLSENELFSFSTAKNLKKSLDSNDNKFILCIGGGYLGRKYQELLRENGYGEKYQHEVGIGAIDLNAIMLHSVFGDQAEDEILRYEDYDSDNPLTLNRKYMITAAGSPGHSSDWNAVKLALRSGAKEVISLKNVDGVYTSDPRIYSEAKRLENVTWDQYLDIIGNPAEHKPGAHYPVDPLASKLAKENNISFYIVSGKDMENFGKLLNKETYIGSLIKG